MSRDNGVRNVLLVFLGACSLIACNHSGGAGIDGSGTVTGDGPSSDGTLTIVSLSSDVNRLTRHANSDETETVNFIAIVTDTNGLDSIAGGSLEDETGATYTAFGAGAQKGTYVAAIDWSHINIVNPIDLPAGGTRVFIAKFYDNFGHTISKAIAMTFQCRFRSASTALTGACHDDCYDASNCGGCGHACGTGEVCSGAGTCVPVTMNTTSGACFDLSSVTITTCDEYCQTLGKTCDGGFNTSYFSDPMCNQFLHDDPSCWALQSSERYVQCWCK